MNNETIKNTTENNSLMRKTKAQLVEIILRKDNIEKLLRTDIKNKEENLQTTNKYLTELKSNFLLIQHDYDDICLEKNTIEYELNNKINKQRKIIICLLSIICVIALIFILFNL